MKQDIENIMIAQTERLMSDPAKEHLVFKKHKPGIGKKSSNDVMDDV